MRFSGPLAWCLVALLASSGCARRKTPAPAPAATIVIPKPKPAQTPPLPPGPTLNTSRIPESKPPEARIELPPPPPKPVPAKKARRTARKGSTAPKPDAPKVAETKPLGPDAPKPETDSTKPETDAPKTEMPAVVTPQLEVILTPEQNRDYSKRIDLALDRAKNAVQLIQSKSLNSAQKDTVARIQSFIAQAEQAKGQDLVSSLSLAERADILSKDLLDRIR